jgi:hypothetical protein
MFNLPKFNTKRQTTNNKRFNSTPNAKQQTTNALIQHQTPNTKRIYNSSYSNFTRLNTPQPSEI